LEVSADATGQLLPNTKWNTSLCINDHKTKTRCTNLIARTWFLVEPSWIRIPPPEAHNRLADRVELRWVSPS
jgi:hypothetical protein